jgi:phospholipase C
MDNFLVFNTGGCAVNAGHPTDLIMGCYDGNTVTALWNYAQNFATNDNSFGTGFGPSTPGAINPASGKERQAGVHVSRRMRLAYDRPVHVIVPAV